MIFRVGQKVVCVDAKPRHYPGCRLVEGLIYTITATGINPIRGYPIVWVAEAKAVSRHGFFSDRFRPVVERKTDISIFTRMLTPAPRVKQPVTPGD